MTQFDCEMSLMKLVEAAMAVAKAYDADIENLSLTCIGDYISVRGTKEQEDAEGGNTVINACRTDDGTILCYSPDYKIVKAVSA